MASFRERVRAAARSHGSWLCVGLDPDVSRLPEAQRSASDVTRFVLDIIDRTSDLACAYKPNAAFFEALGTGGHDALAEVCRTAGRHAPVILDAKRGDIGNTARAYATWAFDVVEADAITVHPYMGHDSVEPFLERADRAAFILARTSNPGAEDLETLALASGERVYERVVALARKWDTRQNVGLVAGATAPGDLARVRELAGPDVPLLIPGVGAQGGTPGEAIRAGANADGEMAIVNASRSIMYADDPRAAAEALRAALS